MGKKYYIRKEEIQIVFKSDPELKGAALEKAKQEGVTLKAVLCMAMKAYVNDELVMGMWQNVEHYELDDESPPPKKQVKNEPKKEEVDTGQKKVVRKSVRQNAPHERKREMM